MREASPALTEEDHHHLHLRHFYASPPAPIVSTKRKKKTNKTNEEYQEEEEEEEGGGGGGGGESSKMVVFLEEENGFVVSPFSAPPPRSRSQSATRKVTPTPTILPAGVENVTDGKVVEKALPNGDLYSGSFSGSVPHGSGKYLWADGCMYEGEWRRGKAAGKGRFSWPSGATFEGEFKSGRMEGSGTFTGADGDTYRGFWVADRKHGHGQKRYANGDYYEGGWRRNLQEGQGRYVWRNGNQYVGEWKSGVISGRGVLIWANGIRFDGQWESGVPKGGGVFTWPDGSCYVVNSLLQPKNQHLHGTFYPSTNPTSAMQSVPLVPVRRSSSNPFGALAPSASPLFKLADSLDSSCFLQSRKRSSVDAAIGRGSYAEKHFPRICIWESDGEAGDITCDIVDTIEASMLYKDGIDKVVAAAEAEEGQRRQQQQQQQSRSPWCFIGGEPKKPGHTISKGHKNYDLMRNLQLGISYSVGKPSSSTQLRDLRTADFDPREKFWTRFPPEGSKITPPHQSAEFRWKDYCPMVFRHLRKLFAVDPADYMLAICGNEALRELSSPGKSGSFFYLTQDDRFMIKTVRKSEVKVLIRMLPSYFRHVSLHRNTLVTKFFGVHCVKPVGGQKVRFIVMGNLFCSEYRIHRRFDLKGSSHGRTADKTEGEIDETTTLKDLDLNFVFRLQHSWFQDLLRQINQDCEFLEAEGIMDYSLLVGLHFWDDVLASKLGLSPSRGGMLGSHPSEAGIRSMDGLLDDWKPSIRLGANMPARAELIYRSELDMCIWNGSESLTPGQSGEIYEVILYFGIIDILQDYDISKKLEHAYKSLQVDPTSISAVDPKLYSKRFRDFIQRVFVEDR